MGTQAFDVKDALYNLLKADSAILAIMPEDAVMYGVQGNFGANESPRQAIKIGEIEWDDELSVGLGMSRRDEYFRILIVVESFELGDTQQEANNRVKAVMQRIETLVRNPRWSGLPVLMTELKPQLLSEGPGDEGRAAIQIMSLHVQARKS